MLYSFIYLFLGIFIANWGYYKTRKRESHASPVKGSLWFYLKDNWIRLLHSVPLAVALCILFNIRPELTTKLIKYEWFSIYSVVIGLCPDAITALLKDALGWMQPTTVKSPQGKIYERK